MLLDFDSFARMVHVAVASAPVDFPTLLGRLILTTLALSIRVWKRIGMGLNLRRGSMSLTPCLCRSRRLFRLRLLAGPLLYIGL